MSKRTLVKPLKDEIPVKIKKLYKDHGYRRNSRFSCGVCGFDCHERIQPNESYDKCRPQIIEHLINEHPDYVYGCSTCPQLFARQEDFRKHICNKVLVNKE